MEDELKKAGRNPFWVFDLVFNRVIVIFLSLIFFVCNLPGLMIYPKLVWDSLNPSEEDIEELKNFAGKLEKKLYYWRLKKYYDARDDKPDLETVRGQWEE